jgi:hypothetical protein
MPSNILYTEETIDSLESRNLTGSSIGRHIGILLLCQLLAALTLPFILSKPITVGSPAFLTAVEEHSFQIRSSVFLSFIGSALTVWLGISMFKVLRRFNQSAAILFLIVCSMSCILDLVHAATILSMLSVSSSFVASGGTASELYQVVGSTVAYARRSAHITQLLAIGAWMFVFYISLLRFNLIPRVLAAIGVIGVAMQFTGVTLMMLLGRKPIGELAMPLLPIEITVGVWLILKGFKYSTVHRESEL